MSGLLAVLARIKQPLVATFHGNDINPIHPKAKFRTNWNQLLSWIVYVFSEHSIFVTKELSKRIGAISKKSSIIPCQVNLDTFYPIDKLSARQELKLPTDKKLVLFSSSFNNAIKNYQLAKRACDKFENLELLELRGFSRSQVNLLLNSCDLALLTSYNEGSTQFIKEAMACNRPVVSTMVGDSSLVFGQIPGCYLTSFNVEDVVSNIAKALDYSQKFCNTDGRRRIIELGLDSDTISRKIFMVYEKVVNKCAESAG